MIELFAHRAGNSVAGIDVTRSLPIGVELDAHLHGGRVVVRHAKRVWFTSRLWERWYLLPAGTEVPDLDEVLGWFDGDVHLWIDCKGIARRLGETVLSATGPDRPITLSSKSWWILGRVAGRPGVRTIRSAGNRFELLLLRFLPSGVDLDGVVVHRRLLTARLVAELRRKHGLVFSWSIGTEAVARELVGWGVDGLIVDDPALLAALSDAGVELDEAGGDPVRESESAEGDGRADEAVDDVVVAGDDDGDGHQERGDHGERP